MTSLITRGSLFDDFFKDVAPGFFIKPLHGDALPAASQIRVDVTENEKEYAVHAEIPGVNKEDIQVSIEVLRSERYYGAVSRSFQLPADIDEAAAKARYEDGVLLLTLPKKISSAPQRLVVE